MSTHQAHIEQLAGSDRGRRVLSILAALQREVSHCDTWNSAAALGLVGVMAAHQLNGTMGEALRPYAKRDDRADLINALGDSIQAWEDEEDSVQEEHAELITRLNKVFDDATK